MLTIRWARTALREIVFGPPIPQFCTVGLKYPQSEVRVWLRGLGSPLDVTDTNVIVTARPFTVGIGLEAHSRRGYHQKCPSVHRISVITPGTTLARRNSTLLRRDDLHRRPGTLPVQGIALNEQMLAQKRGLEALPGFCPSATSIAKGPTPPETRMIIRELFALSTFYICPRPVVLVSVVDGNAGNIFPMDLIGPIGGQHFTLALHCNQHG